MRYGPPAKAASGASLLDTAVSYGTNNQISSVSSPALTVAYDGAGNVTNDGYNTYLYDAEGRICALNGPQGMFGYQYDAAGNRVGRGTITSMSTCDITQNGYQPASDYVLDLSGGQMTEVSVGGGTQNWVHTNVTANGMLIATYDTTGSGLHFYLNDALGSRRVQTDPAGFPEQTCQNLPFGDQLYCTGSLTSPTEHHFTGKERDTESSLDYFGARYYGSSMGRFMSPDPSVLDYADFTNPQSFNLYSYVRNNPLTGTDPTGMAYCQWEDGTHDNSANTGHDDAVNSGTDCTNQGGTWSHADGLGDDGNPLPTATPFMQVTVTENSNQPRTPNMNPQVLYLTDPFLLGLTFNPSSYSVLGYQGPLHLVQPSKPSHVSSASDIAGCIFAPDSVTAIKNLKAGVASGSPSNSTDGVNGVGAGQVYVTSGRQTGNAARSQTQSSSNGVLSPSANAGMNAAAAAADWAASAGTCYNTPNP